MDGKTKQGNNISLVSDTFKTAGDNNNIDNIPPKETINNISSDKGKNIEFKSKKEFVIFKNQIDAMVKNNLYILKECKESKRLLDLKYDTLNNSINYIQISVIFLSTIMLCVLLTNEYFKILNKESIISL